MITDIEDFFTKGCGRCDRFATPDCSTRKWEAGLESLRRICLDAGLAETVKWGHPCYMHAGRNIALIGAFRGDFRLSFMDAALLKDPEGILEKNGPNTQHRGVIRFTASKQAEEMARTVNAYLKEAMSYADAGIKPKKQPGEIELPDELVEALDNDLELAEAFHSLTPGRQRSYIINLNGAKQASTRVARIGKFRDRILAGKGAMER
ncbi:YdeI/OmpD-associated family protein [Pelagibius sp. CAU 1746]|uniref:YdeI/OmpD-associated family protein n=1 Tax=Pelagibius sp. CAU 1746 TaxID=3140370 RepID=UPI00325B9113